MRSNAKSSTVPPPMPRRVGRHRAKVLVATGVENETSLLDLVDNLLDKGVVLNGDVVFGIAGVDLIYLRLSALFCAADRVYE